jgi:hypothetical protein
MRRFKRVAILCGARRKLPFILGGLLAIGSIAWAGSTPWKSKAFERWDENDVHRVLFESPWVHIVTVVGTWRTPGDEVSGLPGPGPPAGLIGGSAGGPGAGLSALSVAAVGSQRAEYPDIPFVVNWISSRTMRAAIARRDVLRFRKTEAEAEKYAREPQNNYAILLQGADMSPFLHAGEKYYQANSFLLLKNEGRKASPVRVEIQREPVNKTVVAAFFYFAKNLPTGAPLIPSVEESIEFTCKIGTSKLKVTFELKKMTTEAGADL